MCGRQKPEVPQIAHVAVRKRHQQQDEIITFFTRTILESGKLFFSASTHTFHTSVCGVKHVHLKQAHKAYAVRTGLR